MEKSGNSYLVLVFQALCLLVFIAADIIVTGRESPEGAKMVFHAVVAFAALLFLVNLAGVLFIGKGNTGDETAGPVDYTSALQSISREYGGACRDGGKPHAELLYRERKFVITSDIDTFRVSFLASRVAGLLYACPVWTDLSFWVVRMDLYASPFETAINPPLKYPIGDFVLITRNAAVQRALAENKAFRFGVESLKDGMYFLCVVNQKSLQYANRGYRKGMIEQLDYLAHTIEGVGGRA